jgi:hypothetical protein
MSKKKKVRCLETNEIFESMTEAAKIIGIPRNAISDLCHGRRLGYNGLHFEIIKESDSNE